MAVPNGSRSLRPNGSRSLRPNGSGSLRPNGSNGNRQVRWSLWLAAGVLFGLALGFAFGL